jgi:transposase InsO family protein
MSINMPKTIKEERLRWILPIINKELKLIDVAKLCPHSKRSLERWVSAYKQGGDKALEPKSTQPKSQPHETAIRLKEEIISLRKKTKLCSQKLHWKLKKKGINVPVRTIGKIIKQEGLTRRYRTRKIQCKYIKPSLNPGELIEIDVKYVPHKLNSRRYYQFTAIDVASRWRYLAIYDAQSNDVALQFLNDVIEKFTYPIQAIKTDNGAIFTNRYTGYLKSSDTLNPRLHPLDLECQRLNIIHYLIDPGKPAQNGTVERSHRSDQEHFYDCNKFKSVTDLKRKIRVWNNYYNDLEHCGLKGLTPNEALKI